MKRQLQNLIQKLLNFLRYSVNTPEDDTPLYYYGREVYASSYWEDRS